MSSPFRSEAEQIREQIRRAEESLEPLRREHADLLKRVGSERQSRLRALLLGGVVITLLVFGYGFGHLSVERTARAERLEQQRWWSHITEQESAAVRACDAEKQSIARDVDRCEEQVTLIRQSVAQTKAARAATCRCPREDPFCTCHDDPPFDDHAAEAALQSARASIEDCVHPNRDVFLQTTVTFAVSGRVEIASVTTEEPGAISLTENSCVETVLRSKPRVPPFRGARVMLAKTYFVKGGT